MTIKFLKVRIDQAKRDAFFAKAKANGLTMTEVIQSWIDEYLTDEKVASNLNFPDQQMILDRLEAVEKTLEIAAQASPSLDRTTEEKLEKQIQYVDQRIDTLETVVITPLKDELEDLKHSWKALFNQMRGLEGSIKKIHHQLEDIPRENERG